MVKIIFMGLEADAGCRPVWWWKWWVSHFRTVEPQKKILSSSVSSKIPVVLLLIYSEISLELCTKIARLWSDNLIRESIIYSFTESILQILGDHTGILFTQSFFILAAVPLYSVRTFYWLTATFVQGKIIATSSNLFHVLSYTVPPFSAFSSVWGCMWSHLSFASSLPDSWSSLLISPFFSLFSHHIIFIQADIHWVLGPPNSNTNSNPIAAVTIMKVTRTCFPSS